MKNIVKILLISLAVGLYYSTMIFAGMLYSFDFPIYQIDLPVYQRSIDKTKLKNYNYSVAGIGESMVEYGLTGDATLYPNKKCLPGDFCAFDCLVPKCKNGNEYKFIKKLSKIENDCYYFYGNKKPWYENGILVQSFDSKIYGCLKPNEFEMKGVVTQ